MDRMLYTALNALAVARNEQVAGAQNLANQTVPGFRRDLPNDGGTRFLDQMGSLTTRAFQLENGTAGFSEQMGLLESTGQELDVAIADRGYFYVLPETGEPALRRRGDLRRDVEGTLRNGAGEAMLGPNLAPVVLPAYASLMVTDIGEIFIAPIDAPGGEPVFWPPRCLRRSSGSPRASTDRSAISKGACRRPTKGLGCCKARLRAAM